MEGESVLYCGRVVPKKGFRTFVYGAEGSKKLVESWPEYQEQIATGVWFSVPQENVIQKPDKKRGKR